MNVHMYANDGYVNYRRRDDGRTVILRIRNNEEFYS